ncbi:uncharacterized mitochondrial protein AtMg00810-like [Medicago truncatula]|uniref:uncharacterized mitochondrial protein AtMg00810-like n=1 Tax=Medicago truncatula TaxID=3880 RepID=UPI000D2F2CE6|nr:uncharacterized mitochondrial protein AtMg00810-like [Medicago truncatula]
MTEFEMTDLGKLTYFPGMEFTKTSECLVMHQKKYATNILKRFNMMGFNPASTPSEVNLKLVKNEDEELVDPTLIKQIIESLRYLCNSRPYIIYHVGIICRFKSEVRSSHFLTTKRVMRNIKGTLGYELLFPANVNGAIVNLMTCHLMLF